MEHAFIAQWVATCLIAVGLITTWVKNGRQSAKNESELKSEVKHINKKLDDPNSGLGAIKASVDEQKVHCANVSSALKAKVEALEKK